MFENSSIAAATRAIYRNLQDAIISKYGVQGVEDSYVLVDSIMKIHGMSKDNFGIITTIEDLLIGDLADISIDSNSNKNDKTIHGVLREAQKPIDKIVGYRFLYRSLVKLYGKKEAKRLTGELYDYTLALSDSTSILVPYCWAFDASKLVIFGKPFGQLPSKQVKRVDSYISLLNEVLHQMSNHLAGAIAIGTFFLDITHLLLVKEKVPLSQLMHSDELRKDIENQFQRFVHGVNSLSRSGGVESPFTNISLFDRRKLEVFVEEYAWYFMDCGYPKEQIIDYVMELQKIFMAFFDKGDPMNDGLPYRFPVVTVNLSKLPDGSLGDPQFVKSICKQDIYRYNIFVSEGNKVASCCRLINNSEMLELASQANSFGAGSSVSLGSHRVLTINFARLALLAKDKSDFYALLKDAVKDSKKILYAHKELIRSLKDVQLFLKNGWIQLDRLFSTIGIMGYVEAQSILKKKGFCENEDMIFEMLVYLNNEVNSNNEQYKGCVFNIEQIPGESMSHRLARADALLFGEENVPFSIYANQFVPLWDTKPTIWERMQKAGMYNSLLTGGGIFHCNTGEHITGKQAEKIIEYAVKSNCEHFAITGTFCKCEEGHVVLGDRDSCAICGGGVISKVARTVGFFTPVEDWSSYKIDYDFKKRHEYTNGDFNTKDSSSVITSERRYNDRAFGDARVSC